VVFVVFSDSQLFTIMPFQINSIQYAAH
jgi:hypothetical protein